MLPLRIAASVAMTPFFAERLVSPIVTAIRRGIKK
jgi:hypothetical protein